MRNVSWMLIVTTLLTGWCHLGHARPAPDLKVPLPHAWGMNIDSNPGFEEEFQKTKEAHFKWVRLTFWWRGMEADGPGQVDWSEMDRQVNWAVQRGLKIYANFASFPAWTNGTSKDCQTWVTFNCSYPPTDPAYFVSFVRRAVARYKNKIHYWGLGNEPNHGAFWNRRPDQTEEQSREQYLDDILERGAMAVRSVDPTAKIVGPDLSNLSKLQPEVWLKDVLTKKAAFIDIISHHDYSRSADLVISRIAGDVRKVIVESGQGNDKKPFWLTEIGFNSDYGEKGHWQAESYLKVLESAPYYSWWRGTFIYRISDQPRDNHQSFGIVGPPRLFNNVPPASPFIPWENREAFDVLQKFLSTAPGF